MILAHGGIPGLIAETGSVFGALAVCGFCGDSPPGDSP